MVDVVVHDEIEGCFLEKPEIPAVGFEEPNGCPLSSRTSTGDGERHRRTTDPGDLMAQADEVDRDPSLATAEIEDTERAAG
jgi:hypothetical protein